MSLREAAQQALEALEYFEEAALIEGNYRTHGDLCTALRAALAEPVQEPVAWRVQRNDGEYELYFVKASAERAAECYIKRPPVEPLYTAPPQRSAIQQTHSEDCWRWHHECAIAKIERCIKLDKKCLRT